MKYEDINTPLELLNFLINNIEYGICDEEGYKYRESDMDFNLICNEKWKLSSPYELLRNKIGLCWDFVELERAWFKSNNYKFKTIFIMFFDTNLPTHTFLAYEENNKWHWFECSDFNNRGIHVFNSYAELISEQKKKHIEYVSSFTKITDELLNKLHIIEYSIEQYGMNGLDFINYIVDNGKEVDL